MTEKEVIEGISKLHLEPGDVLVLRVSRDQHDGAVHVANTISRGGTGIRAGSVAILHPGDEIGKLCERDMERAGWIRLSPRAAPTISAIVDRLSAEWGYLPARERSRLSGELQAILIQHSVELQNLLEHDRNDAFCRIDALRAQITALEAAKDPRGFLSGCEEMEQAYQSTAKLPAKLPSIPLPAISPLCATCGDAWCAEVQGAVLLHATFDCAGPNLALNGLEARGRASWVESRSDFRGHVVLRAREIGTDRLAVLHLRVSDLASGVIAPICGVEELAKAINPRG